MSFRPSRSRHDPARPSGRQVIRPLVATSDPRHALCFCLNAPRTCALRALDFDDDQRIGFALKSVIIGRDEHSDPITVPVVIAEETQALMTPRDKPLKVAAT